MANLAVAISMAIPENELALNAEVDCKACRNVGNPSNIRGGLLPKAEATYS
jgi:hypothetical protein